MLKFICGLFFQHLIDDPLSFFSVVIIVVLFYSRIMSQMMVEIPHLLFTTMSDLKKKSNIFLNCHYCLIKRMSNACKIDGHSHNNCLHFLTPDGIFAVNQCVFWFVKRWLLKAGVFSSLLTSLTLAFLFFQHWFIL